MSPRWDLVYKWADPETRTLVEAVTSSLENCDRKLTETEARASSPQPDIDVERLAAAWIDLIERAMWALTWREYATERDLAVNIVRRIEELHGPEGGIVAAYRSLPSEPPRDRHG